MQGLIVPLLLALSTAPQSHPLQPQLECRVDSHSFVQAFLYVHANGTERKLATYGSLDPAGACEYASRNARNGSVCAPQNYDVKALSIATGAVTGSYGSEGEGSYKACFAATNRETLATRPGFVEFIAPARLAPFKTALPQVADADVQSVLNDADTMWYDELSMVFTYQDSQGDPKGLRANRVGWDVGDNASEPDIHKLVQYFQPGTFRPPFKTGMGLDQVAPQKKYLLNFMNLPKAAGKTVPVKYWELSNTRWRWTYPVGTTFGEVFYEQAPDDGSWYVFEIRTRKRYAGGWTVNAFRPFPTAKAFADAIRVTRPNYQSSDDLAALVRHLEDPSTLEAHTMTGAEAYKAIFPGISGAIDYIPETRDYGLIKELLKHTTFQSSEGAIWKEGNGLETYAASTKAPFSIVPADYEAGLVAVNEESCNRCHEQTGRELGDLDDRIVLYGEMWGEDRIFTFHLFEAGFDAFTVSDGSRRVNPRMTTAKIVERGQPQAGDARYAAPLDPPSGHP